MLRKDIIRPLKSGGRTADPNEIARFDALSEEWWKPNGKFKVVHAFNAARVDYIINLIGNRSKQTAPTEKPLAGLNILDVGCGAGLVSEPLARNGAAVTALDASAQNIEVARRHAEKTGVDIDYICATPEEIMGKDETYDIVLSLEVVEHVSDLPSFLDALAKFIRPEGLLILGTLNRTLRSKVLAIYGAEYILGWLPKGTHDWQRFVKPQELDEHFSDLGFTQYALQGIAFNPLRWEWKLSANADVNYLQAFEKNSKA